MHAYIYTYTTYVILRFTDVMHKHLYMGNLSTEKRCGSLKGGCFCLPPVCVSLFVHLNHSLDGGCFTLRLHQKRQKKTGAASPGSQRPPEPFFPSRPFGKRPPAGAAARLRADSRRGLHFKPPFRFLSFPPPPKKKKSLN